MERQSNTLEKGYAKPNDILIHNLTPIQSSLRNREEHQAFNKIRRSRAKGILVPNILVSNPDYLDASAIHEPSGSSNPKQLLIYPNSMLTVTQPQQISQKSVSIDEHRKSCELQSKVTRIVEKQVPSSLNTSSECLNVQTSKARINQSFDFQRNTSQEMLGRQPNPGRRMLLNPLLPKKANSTANSFYDQDPNVNSLFLPVSQNSLNQLTPNYSQYSSLNGNIAALSTTNTISHYNPEQMSTSEFSEFFKTKISHERLRRRILEYSLPRKQLPTTQHFFRAGKQEQNSFSSHPKMDALIKVKPVPFVVKQNLPALSSNLSSSTQKLFSQEYKESAKVMKTIKESTDEQKVQDVMPHNDESSVSITNQPNKKVVQKSDKHNNQQLKNDELCHLQMLELARRQVYFAKNRINYSKLLQNITPSTTEQVGEKESGEELQKAVFQKNSDQNLQERFEQLMQMNIAQDFVQIKEIINNFRRLNKKKGVKGSDDSKFRGSAESLTKIRFAESTQDKAPKPIAVAADQIIFTKDGRLKEQLHGLCLEIGLEPHELELKPLESFKEKDVGYNIQVLRFNHYENKRQAKVEALKALARERFPGLFQTRRKSKPSAKEAGLPNARRTSFTNPELERRRSSYLENTKNEVEGNDRSGEVLRAYQKDKAANLAANSSNISIKKDDNQDASSEDSNASSVLNRSFDHFLSRKRVEKQRQRSAHNKAVELMFRQSGAFREKVQNKEQKYLQTLKQMQLTREKSLKEKHKFQFEKNEFIKNLQKEEAKMRRKKEQQLSEQIEKGKKLADEHRKKRVELLSAQWAKRLEKMQEFEEYEAEQNAFLTEDQLADHEIKMTQKIENHNIHLQMRIATRNKYHQDIEKRLKKTRELELLDESMRIKALIDRMNKTEELSKRSKTPKSVQQTESLDQKILGVQQRKKTVEKERNKEINLKVTKRHEIKEKFWTEKKHELQEHIKTKKEMQNLKREDVFENLALFTTVKERENEKKLKDYLAKTRRFEDWKKQTRQEILDLDRSFRLADRRASQRARTSNQNSRTNASVIY